MTHRRLFSALLMLATFVAGVFVAVAACYFYAKMESFQDYLELRTVAEMRDVGPVETSLRLQDYYINSLNKYERRFGSPPINVSLELARAHFIMYLMLGKMGKIPEANNQRSQATNFLQPLAQNEVFSDDQIMNMFGLKKDE